MAIDQAVYTVHATSTGGRAGTTRSSDGAIDLTLATPKELGGAGGPGTNPEQLFAAGYSACFIGAMKAVAGQMKVAVPADVAVDAEVDVLGERVGGHRRGSGDQFDGPSDRVLGDQCSRQCRSQRRQWGDHRGDARGGALGRVRDRHRHDGRKRDFRTRDGVELADAQAVVAGGDVDDRCADRGDVRANGHSGEAGTRRGSEVPVEHSTVDLGAPTQLRECVDRQLRGQQREVVGTHCGTRRCAEHHQLGREVLVLGVRRGELVGAG